MVINFVTENLSKAIELLKIDNPSLIKADANAYSVENSGAYTTEFCNKARQYGVEIYSQQGEALNKIVVDKLKLANTKLAVAESLTGGLLSSAVVDISGSSAVFTQGIVAYSNLAKHALLKVSQETLDKFGAVSAQTALEMAVGLRQFNADVYVSTTGIAGPMGDGICNIVGKTFIGIADKHTARVFEYTFEGDRAEIRRCAVNCALVLLNRYLDGYTD